MCSPLTPQGKCSFSAHGKVMHGYMHKREKVRKRERARAHTHTKLER
jgi:hypothetical protein